MISLGSLRPVAHLAIGKTVTRLSVHDAPLGALLGRIRLNGHRRLGASIRRDLAKDDTGSIAKQ